MVKRWSGYLILGMWLLNLLHLYLGFSPWPASVAAWAASLLTWPWLVGAAKRQALALYGAALALLPLCDIVACYCHASAGSGR